MAQVREAGPERDLAARILRSATFQRSPRLRDLLVDIVERSLAGEAALLSEHAIGVRVFGRAESYNPADDNIVRASARHLRQKLKEYFETEGAGEEWILEIPRGGYTAVFRLRSPEGEAPRQARPAWPWAVLAAAALLFAGSFLLWREAARPAPSAPTLFTELAAAHPGPVEFVLTDSAMVIQNQMLNGAVDVDSYSTRGFEAEYEKRKPPEDALRVWRFLNPRQITSLADVTILSSLLRTHPELHSRIELRHARHMATRAFKQGNFILTGGYTANPWAKLFENRFRFRFDHERHQFENLEPRPGEAARYPNDARRGRYVARIGLTRNLSDKGFVLHLAGTAFEGTEGAGEYLFRAGALQEIRKAVGWTAGEIPPPFELILESAASQGTASPGRIIAVRRH
jgi:hypothetical protein